MFLVTKQKVDLIIESLEKPEQVLKTGPGQTGVKDKADIFMEKLNADCRKEMSFRMKRDEVLLRDQGQCTYIHVNGKRCKTKRWLHIHHIIPKSQGGLDHIDNLRTLCALHHDYLHFQAGWQRDRNSKRLQLSESKRQGDLLSF